MNQTVDKTRRALGLEKLAELDGQNGEQAVTSMGELGRYLVEFGFGEIYSRKGLSLRDREFAAVAMLIAMGRDPQMRFHLGAALNVGLTAEELEELIIHTVLVAGFPTAINALAILKEVLAETPANGSPKLS
jgi:4-carboxymuconolactone decarboxylase